MSDALLCIMGPTASGKTQLAIELAEALNGELVSVDSALVYRGLDIGSAKPSYPHHLIDICEPNEAFSAARFVEEARDAIAAIRERGRRPILVGGTMLYYRALLHGLAPMPAADPALRGALEARAWREGWPALHAELALRDPGAAARIHPNHSQRLLRALEICMLTGRTLEQVHSATMPAPMAAMCMAIAPLERQLLHQRIEARLLSMMDDGFLDEVRRLYQRPGLHSELPAMRSVGYRQLWAHLDGRWDLPTAIDKAVAATRQLAKRQYTWLRKWPDLHWILTDTEGQASADGGVSFAKSPTDVALHYLRGGAM